MLIDDDAVHKAWSKREARMPMKFDDNDSGGGLSSLAVVIIAGILFLMVAGAAAWFFVGVAVAGP